MGFAILSGGTLRVSAEAGSPLKKKEKRLPLQKGQRPKSGQKPGTGRIPGGFCPFGGNAAAKPDGVRLDKGFQNLGFGAFSVHFCAYKSEPQGPGPGRPRRKAPGARGRHRPHPLQHLPYRQGVDGGVEENRAPEGAGAIIGPGQHQARGQVLEHEKKIAEAVIDHSELPHVEEGKEKA